MAVVLPLIALYATGLLKEVFPSVPDLACQVRELTRSHTPGPKFRILLTTLDHDTDGRLWRDIGGDVSASMEMR